MTHRWAKLTEVGRALLVQRVVVEGWSPCAAGEACGVSRATFYKKLAKFDLAASESPSVQPARPEVSQVSES